MQPTEAAPVSAVTTAAGLADEPAALLGVVAAPSPFRLAVVVIDGLGRDALARYLDQLDDALLIAVSVYWPGGRKTAAEVVRRELWHAGRRRRRARGWTHWPPALMSAAAHLAGPAGNTEDTR